jgi:amino acid transporter
MSEEEKPAAPIADHGVVPGPTEEEGLQRGIDWTGAFWMASGVPALVLFSIGSIGATVGSASWIVWIVSIAFGFVQAFSYAEIAGLFPNKSGGASVYGAVAWVRYSKLFAPFSVWCNWVAWAPVLSIGSGLAAGYVLTILFGADNPVNTWQITLLPLEFIKTGLALRINATFVLGAVILLIAFVIQGQGISNTAKAQIVLGCIALLPLLIIGIVPLFLGDFRWSNLVPITPLAKDAMGMVIPGQWDMKGITLIAGGLFIAAWSTYGFETAVCYTREFRDPKRDTVRAILYSGLLCIVVFSLVPLTFQGVLGVGQLISPAVTDAAGAVVKPAEYSGILASDIYSGMGVGRALSAMVHAGAIGERIIVAMLVLALVLAIITSMSGCSRTLYQASLDGWLPKFLSGVNAKGAPTTAMWTNLIFNLVLLMMSDYVFVLAMSNVCYIIFNFLNLNSAWIHRLDRPHIERPFRAPTILIVIGTTLSFVNIALLGMGANVWGPSTLITGVIVACAVIPLFLYRHYVTDKGEFPDSAKEDMQMAEGSMLPKRAGILPYLTLAAGIGVVIVTSLLAKY